MYISWFVLNELDVGKRLVASSVLNLVRRRPSSPSSVVVVVRFYSRCSVISDQ